MISLIEVTCPHCAAHGQIMLPPPGAIIIGPCPECQESVAVFCGRVLPLNSEVMKTGSTDEKRSHVGAVLGDFLHNRIKRLFADTPENNTPTDAGTNTSDHPEPRHDSGSGTAPATEQQAISSAELESFINVDLRLLDNAEYFKAIFDQD